MHRQYVDSMDALHPHMREQVNIEKL